MIFHGPKGIIFKKEVMIKQKSCSISRYWFLASEGLQHIFPEFKRVDFASFFVWYFQGKVANLEIPRVYSKNISSTPHVWVFLEKPTSAVSVKGHTLIPLLMVNLILGFLL